MIKLTKRATHRRRVAQRPGKAVLEQRAERLRTVAIEYIDNESFHGSAAKGELRIQTAAVTTDAGALPRGLPEHLGRLCAAPLLTHEEEQSLFRRMNLLKCHAAALQQQICIRRPVLRHLDQIENSLAEAEAIRNRIVQANMRLVIAVVKKFATPQISFDELLSDGTLTLLGAVEKFDFDRGFRFSTYAYRSIARNAYRTVTDRQRDQRRQALVDAPVEEIAQPAELAALDERSWETLRGLLGKMLARLDGRERTIVSARYALGKQRNSETFQSIADKLGVSKERVRQLEQRAVNKLRAMAVQWNVEELLAPRA